MGVLTTGWGGGRYGGGVVGSGTGGGGTGLHRDAQTQELFAMSGAELRAGGERFQRLVEERDANEVLGMLANEGIMDDDFFGVDSRTRAARACSGIRV